VFEVFTLSVPREVHLHSYSVGFSVWCPYLSTTEQENFESHSVILLSHRMIYITRAPDFTVSRPLPAQEFTGCKFTGSTPNHFHTFSLIPRKVLESKDFSLIFLTMLRSIKNCRLPLLKFPHVAYFCYTAEPLPLTSSTTFPELATFWQPYC